MSIQHHLTEDILIAYSAGNLPEAFNLIVAAHISLCDECRAQSESYDALGGSLVEDSGGVQMDDDALEATLRLIEAGDAIASPLARPNGGVFPSPLAEYVGGDVDAVKWRPVGMGVKQAILPTSKDATARLLYIPAGCAMPDHGHHGTEMTLVLQGAFIDEDERFGRGDIEVADEDMHHTPIADVGEDCICLAVTDAPLKFSGLIPRIAQPFLRI